MAELPEIVQIVIRVFFMLACLFGSIELLYISYKMLMKNPSNVKGDLFEDIK